MKFRCEKCQNDTYELENFTNISKELTRLINQETKKFVAISCTECGYTEIYKVNINYKQGDVYFKDFGL